MPWMALAPDISGVCSVEDTLEMTSMPTKTLRTKIVSQTMASLMPAVVPSNAVGSARARIGAVVGDARAGDDLVLEVGGEGACRSPRSRVISVTMLTTFWA